MPAPHRRGRRASASHPNLPLALPAPPALPGHIAPELSVPCATPFDDGGWRFGVDWDGCRALAYVASEGAVRVQGQRLQDLTSQLPEFRHAAAQLEGHTAVLDGVVAVLDPEGRPDLRRLMARLVAGEPSTDHPAVFLVTDLLHLDGVPTMRWHLDRRLEALAGLIAEGEALQHGETLSGEGRAFAAAASARQLSAVLARRRGAAYHPGVASADRLRIALEDRVDTVIAAVGETPQGARLQIHLAEHASGQWAFAGSATVSRHGRLGTVVLDALDELATGRPWLDIPHGVVTWLRPHLVATVSHRGRHMDGRLRGVECIVVRDDVQPEACVRRHAVAPPGDALGSFLPTVLRPLPMDPREPA